MKAKVKANGKIVEVKPNYYNGKIASWAEVKNDATRIYLPKELELEDECWSISEESAAHTSFLDSNFDRKFVEIKAAIHALSACIIAGKKDAARSAVYYAKQLVEELDK